MYKGVDVRRLFFHLAGQTEDRVGAECRSLKEARAAAVSYLGRHLHRNPAYLDEGHWRVDVTDEQKTLLFKVVVAMVDAPGAGTMPMGPN